MFNPKEAVEFIHYTGRKSQGFVDGTREISVREGYFLGGDEKGFGRFQVTRNGRSRQSPLFYKYAYPANEYIANYQELKKLGLPVPTTMRKIDDDFVAMTDYSAQGAVFFGKAMVIAMLRDYTWLPEASQYVNGIPRYAVQGVFNAYENLSEIERMLDRYEQIANRHGIHLPAIEEHYELAVFPNERWELMLLDLHGVKIGDFNGDDVSKDNRTFSIDTIDCIKAVHKWLSINQLQAVPESEIRKDRILNLGKI